MKSEKVRRSDIVKRIQVSDNTFISIRKEEVTVYKVIKVRGKSTVVYTLDAQEWHRILPVLSKIIGKYS